MSALDKFEKGKPMQEHRDGQQGDQNSTEGDGKQMSQATPEEESEFRQMLRALQGNKIADSRREPEEEPRKHNEESESF